MDDEIMGLVRPNFDEIKAKLIIKSDKTNNKTKSIIKDYVLLKSFNFANLNIKNHLCFINLNDDTFYEKGIPNGIFPKEIPHDWELV